MSARDHWETLVWVLVSLGIFGVAVGIVGLFSYLMYGDASCAFVHCVRVVR